MKKKKYVTLCLLLLLMAATLVGITLAYLSDHETSPNTYTMGAVSIYMEEENQSEGEKLLPGKEIPKNIYISVLDGSETAYVWVEWQIPAEMDKEENNKAIHIAFAENTKWITDPVATLNERYTTTYAENKEPGFIGTYTDDVTKVVYNKYIALYETALSENGDTEIAIEKIWLDSRINGNEFGYAIGDTTLVINPADPVKITYNAYAIQADGFSDVYAAYAAYNTLEEITAG